MPRPLCFMIMPYGRKPTQAEPGHGPTEVDFNALWDRGYVPTTIAPATFRVFIVNAAARATTPGRKPF
jgi:hypothetical protein